ncbi:MAG: PilZ domain-containing protein [Desulfobulbaceae bacterium]|nr:PilZ domain-containing protein [Desulfobulbaceae bacterium]HIJ90294.1 PilZ domain-containing protein [Deltaproteobacteria bacterium]
MTKKKSGTEESAPWELTSLPVAPTGVNPADAADLQKIIRKNYREPILDDDAVCAEIDGRTHRVCDIGGRGMGLIVPTLDSFPAGSPHSITLHIDDNTITLRGKVTHISPSETSGECHCGIEFIDLSKKDEHTLQYFLTAHHARLFGGTCRPADPGRN